MPTSLSMGSTPDPIRALPRTILSPIAFLGLSLLSAALLSATPSANASVADLAWDGPAQVVASAVTRVPPPSGNAAVFSGSQWRIVYERDGTIYLRSRGSSGWEPETAVTSGASARDPHVAAAGDGLYIVWEDDRTGHPEVWTRRMVGGQWSAEECLSADPIGSHDPVVAAGGTEYAYVAWQDSTLTERRVLARQFTNGAWDPVETISSGTPSGCSPSVAFNPGMGDFLCAWVDRHVTVMLHSASGNQAVAAGRHPSIHSEQCCGDCIFPVDAYIAFEAAGSAGATEIRGARVAYEGWVTPYPGSPDDGIPSTGGLACGFDFSYQPCGVPGGGLPNYFVVWSEDGQAGRANAPGRQARTHWIADALEAEEGRLLLSATGLAGCGVAMSEGNPATVLAYWIESREQGPALVARTGTLPGCFSEQIEAPAALLIGPAGAPANVMRAFDGCSGAALAEFDTYLDFDADLDAQITWDDLQAHPLLHETTDEEGIAVFSIRGGGCSQAGEAYACYPAWWPGVKSPDVDGDCVVGWNDVQYVAERLGSDDFCADLDGSGLVDGTDAAIVQATLGDHCSQVMDAGGQLDASVLSLSPLPTPASQSLVLRLSSPEETAVDLRILDAGGRLVRTLPVERIPAGTSAVAWNLRDSAGRAVASGVYFAVLRAGQATLERPVIVTR